VKGGWRGNKALGRGSEARLRSARRRGAAPSSGCDLREEPQAAPPPPRPLPPSSRPPPPVRPPTWNSCSVRCTSCSLRPYARRLVASLVSIWDSTARWSASPVRSPSREYTKLLCMTWAEGGGLKGGVGEGAVRWGG
jgi:hypothetical protein